MIYIPIIFPCNALDQSNSPYSMRTNASESFPEDFSALFKRVAHKRASEGVFIHEVFLFTHVVMSLSDIITIGAERGGGTGNTPPPKWEKLL